MKAPSLFDDMRTLEGVALLSAIDETLQALPFRKLPPDHTRFLDRFDAIRKFSTDQTGITPAMGYLLYECARAATANVAALGVYTGISAGFLAAGAADSAAGVSMVAVEPNADRARVARANLTTLGLPSDAASVVQGEAVGWARIHTQPLGVVFIDVLDPVRQKADYAEIAGALVHLIEPGGTVIGHDALVGRWRDDLDRLERVLADSGRLKGVQTLPVDEVGVVLGILR